MIDLKTVFPKASKSFLSCNSGTLTHTGAKNTLQPPPDAKKRPSMNKTEERQTDEAVILMDEEAQRRFWSYVNKVAGDECWNWILPTKREGYGLFGMKTCKQYGAHRISWILFHRKPVPIGMLICHHCDNPSCVNPAHLFLGTSRDNNRDRHMKGRSKLPILTPEKAARGERCANSKLKTEQVLEIRRRHKDGTTAKSLASMFKVSERAIGQIVHRETWRHV